jgi:hypothetical protein
MAQEVHTFRVVFPKAAIESILGSGTITVGAASTPQLVAVTFDSTLLADVKTEAEQRGWTYVGAGDLTPSTVAFTQTYSTAGTEVTALADWTPPSIAGSYAGGVLSLLNAATNADLNDLRAKCAQLEARISALGDHVVEAKKVDNAVINVLQDRGLAGSA